MGAKAAGIEAHPERRFKAALEKYMDDELPVIRKEYPGLRLQQCAPSPLLQTRAWTWD